MGIFDIWRPNPEKKKPEQARSQASPRKEEPKHFLPGPAAPGKPLPHKKGPRSKFWDPFTIWSPSPEQVKEAREEAARPSKYQEFQEAIVPEAERAHVHAKAEAWRRGARPFESRQQQAASYSPRYGGHHRGPTHPFSPQEESEPISITPEYVGHVFDLEKVFTHVRQLRVDPKFKAAGSTGGVGVISPAGMDSWGKVLKTVEFFGIPERDIIRIPREDVWDRFMKPFLTEVEEVLNDLKPKDLPGSFRFDSAPSGAFGLVYSEP